MSTGFFAALRNDDDDSSASSSDNKKQKTTQVSPSPPHEGSSVTVPAYEDLSNARIDEATVLEAVYGDDFTSKPGVWNYPSWAVRVQPPDLDETKIGSQLELRIQVSKKYPYVVPKIDIQNVTGLSKQEEQELRQELHNRATELAQSGSVMMIELVQVAEDYLLAHNQDPNMSAWEQMKERERNQQLKENEASKALDKLMEKSSTVVTFDETSGRRAEHHGIGSIDVERELLRQREAIELAQKLQATVGDGLLRRSSSATMEPSKDEDDFEIDLDYNPATVSASRYETDFIEMGILGRGGGGEVVKARNRLDGRIYAIKKVLLEREDGAMAKLGALQNQKLRREVTTISRMTHNNIVRYYQAWVEGDGTEDEPGVRSIIDGNSPGFEPSTAPVRVIEEESEEDESDDSQGWWTSFPSNKKGQASTESFDESESKQAGKSSEIVEESDSALDIFGDDDFGIQSPLMNGLGFQNTMYRNLARNYDSSSQSESSEVLSEWDEDSSVKVGTGVKGRKILYIQMEFCSTTLRKLIDDGELEKMEENEIWRLIRQIIEALAYIHGRKLIHRDLKPGKFSTKSQYLASWIDSVLTMSVI